MNSYGISHIGNIRSHNEDAYYNQDVPIGNLPNIYVVADGMGGHLGGEIASRLAVDTFLNAIKHSEGSFIEIIENGIIEANKKVYYKSVEEPHLFGMGTTLTVLTVVDSILYIGHVGDSRLYLCDDNTLKQMTKDHSYVQELVDSGAITEEEAIHHPNKNRITRAVGVHIDIEIDSMEYDLTSLTAENIKILICSDGLTNMIEDDEICSILTDSIGSREKGQKLLSRALDEGGKDNITLILLENVRGW